jgi:putative transposase
MIEGQSIYRGYRFPPEVIGHAVWLHHRFCLSFRDVEDLLAERGIIVSYESVRQWCAKFGPSYARAVKQRQGTLGDTGHLDEVFVTIQGRRQFLWRAVDQDGDTLDILVQARRDRRAAERFFRILLKGQSAAPRSLVTDKLKSYSAARRTSVASIEHVTEKYANSRAEVCHEPTRQREYQMRRFKSPGQAQRFLAVHAAVGNLFLLARHLTRVVHYRMYRIFRARAFARCQAVTHAY